MVVKRRRVSWVGTGCEHSSEVTEVSVEEEISAHHPQTVVKLLLTEMKESLLADNLDHMYGTEYAIEEVTQDI